VRPVKTGAVIRYYCDLRSIHSEDAITWSVFWTVFRAPQPVIADWLAELFRLLDLQRALQIIPKSFCGVGCHILTRFLSTTHSGKSATRMAIPLRSIAAGYCQLKFVLTQKKMNVN
jgi:hypothetical protein